MNPAAWTPWFSNLDVAAYLVVAALVIWLAFLGDRSKGRKRCPKCWYDMNAAPPPGLTCSECGHVCKKASQLHKTRWRWKPVVWGVVVCVLTFGVSNWANLRAGAWLKLIPATLLYVTVEPDYSFPTQRFTLTTTILPDGTVVRRPTPAAPGASLEDLPQILGRELTRRHKDGELPEWIWRRLSLRECVLPIQSDRALYTRAKWWKQQNLILGSDAAAALMDAPNVAGIMRTTRLEISETARAMGINGWPSMIGSTSLRSRPISETRFHIDTSAMGPGRHRIPLAVVCTEEAGGRVVELWRADRVIDVEFVENIGEAIALVDDATANDAVRRCAIVNASPIHGTASTTSAAGRLETVTLHPVNADLPSSCEGSPLLKDLGIAFGFVFFENGREVARSDDFVFPSRRGGLVFETEWDKARLTNMGHWTETARQTLVLRVVGRPEAVLPQLGYRWAWAGWYEVPLRELLRESTSVVPPLPISPSGRDRIHIEELLPR